MPEDYDPRAFFIFMQEQEIWKQIPNYEKYQVSNFGRVKSFTGHNGVKERILNATPNTDGYLMVGVYRNTKRKMYVVHVLVAMLFIGHKPNGTQKLVVDHKDNNRRNNNALNLQLITNRVNATKDRKGGASQYVGVFAVKNRFYSKITFNYRNINLGHYDHEIDAHNAYQKALKELEQGLDLNILYPKQVKTSKYKGVYLITKNQRWAARFENKKYLGSFPTEQEAFEAIEFFKSTLV